jgi:type I restriction enzyme, R subunit
VDGSSAPTRTRSAIIPTRFARVSRSALGPGLAVVALLFPQRLHLSIADWVSRDDVRAKLRSIIKCLLARHGYPPDAQPTATELVLRQMETFAEEWSPEVG